MEHQAISYAAMMKALEGKPWLHGIYWWKWPSTLERGGLQSRDRFTPNRKLAEDVIEDWFSSR